MLKLASTIEEICQSHGISRATFYNLMKRGEAPATMQVGKRRLVSVEAAAVWRSRMENIAASNTAKRRGGS